MRSALAIYITVFAVALVAIAQILYWKLIVNRAGGAGDAAPEIPDMSWALELVDPCAGFEADALEPAPASEPVRVREPVLVGA